MTRDIWKTLSPKKKKETVVDYLQQLHDINNKPHGPHEGYLCSVKRDLEKLLINIAAWEAGKDKI